MYNDLRYAFRQLIKNPAFTAMAALTLALGIGANTAIFSVIDGVLLRSTPFEETERLVMVWETDRSSGTTREPASVPDYLDFRQQGTCLREVAAFTGTEVSLTFDQGDSMRLAAMAVSHEFLPMVGIRPIAGRFFSEMEDRPGGSDVVLIGDDLWNRLFNRDPSAIGRTLRLDDVPRTIVGVLPSDADFGVLQILSSAAYGRAFANRGEATKVDVWLPLRPDPQSTPRSTHPIFVLGRLAPGVSQASAQQQMTAIAAELESAYPENKARGVFVEPLSEVVFGQARPALLVLLAATALVLLVACANVANLLLARGVARMDEVAVRMALGASASRLTRQFLAESGVLTLAAAVSGILFARFLLDLLLALAPADIPRMSGVAIDSRVLAATLAVSVLVSMVFGMLPSFQARRLDLRSSLKLEAGRSVSAGRERRGLRSALVITELALATMLVIGAGLLINSFWRLQHVDPGFRAEGVLKAEFQLPATRYGGDRASYPNWPKTHRFNRELLHQVATLPGVESAALAGAHPLDVGFTNSFVVIGREAEARNWPEISVRWVTPGYFPTLGVPLLSGRLIADSDATFAAPVLLINEEARRRFFADRDPLGQQIRFWGQARTIVGVVGNEKIHGLGLDTPPAAYSPISQAAWLTGSLLVRVRGEGTTLARTVRAAFRNLDPAITVYGVEPLAETLSRSVAQKRFTMLLVAMFAALALLLAAVGIYGVLSYMVEQRTREIGVRSALGAQSADVLRLVLGQALPIVGLGLGLGLGGALVLSRLLRSLLFGVSPTDFVTFAAVSVLLAVVGLAASYFPARRAARMDPMQALRCE